MKFFCGTDIIEVKRIQEAIEEGKENFLDRVYTKKEIMYCEKKKKMKFEHYAGRFAAKEAIFKAISPLLENKYDISWKNIEIQNEKDGRPFVSFIGLSFEKIESIDISISHVKEMAVASCMIVSK